MMKAKGDGGEGLYVRGRSGQRGMKLGIDGVWLKSQGRTSRLRCYVCQSDEHLKRHCPRHNNKKSQGFIRNEDQVSGFGADGYDNVDVMMAMSVEELMDWIIDLEGSYHVTYKRDYLFDFEEYDGGNILLGDGKECRIQGTGKVQVQMRDGLSFMLDNVRYVLELRQNLILMGTLEKEVFTVKMQSGKFKVIRGSMVVLSGTRRANYVYTLDGQAVTKKTLKGRKHLGEYQTGWKIKTCNVLDFCNQRSTQQCMKSEVAKHLGVAVIQQQNGLVKEMNMTLLAKWVIKPWRLDDVTSKVVLYKNLGFNESGEYKKTFIGFGSYREDIHKAAFVVAEAKKIYAHESLTFNNIVICEVISKWKAGLKDDMNTRSHVCKARSGLPRVCWIKQKEMYLTLLEGHSILSLKGSLLGDCDVKRMTNMLIPFLMLKASVTIFLIFFNFNTSYGISLILRHFKKDARGRIWLVIRPWLVGVTFESMRIDRDQKRLKADNTWYLLSSGSGNDLHWQWELILPVGTLNLAVGMPCAFYSQQSSPKLDAPSAFKFSRIK
nr:zinc finger, CCHC-type [Tanacetum cinerariifolium]